MGKVSARAGGLVIDAPAVQTHAPNSTQVVGFLTLAVSGAVLLLPTGLCPSCCSQPHLDACRHRRRRRGSNTLPWSEKKH
uniref:Uncharacterized protein n=1 Tax=Oryza barthii TaxID=65489 RepID=A0A0D3G7I5_9ORYZ